MEAPSPPRGDHETLELRADTHLRPFLEYEAFLTEWLRSMVAQGIGIDEVWICLRRATRPGGSWWRQFMRNRTAEVAGAYVHVELMFKLHNGAQIAFTVDMPEKTKERSGVVRWYERAEEYDDARWHLEMIGTLTPLEQIGLWYYCVRQMGKPMNEWGLWANWLPVLSWDIFIGEPQPEEDAYFCSQLVASALRWIRPVQFRAVNPRRCVPVELYHVLRAHHDMFIITDRALRGVAASRV